MFKNKHMVVAMVVAPILAIISYFATDYIVSEKPQKTLSGQTYKMRVKSNCRWESGKCTIDNGDVSIDITGKYLNSRNLDLNLTSNVELNGIKIAFDKKDLPPQSMKQINPMSWSVLLDTSTYAQKINLAISIKESIFFAQIPTIFLHKRK